MFTHYQKITRLLLITGITAVTYLSTTFADNQSLNTNITTNTTPATNTPTPNTPPPLNLTQPNNTPPSIIPPPPNLNAKGYVLMDANSGQVLAQNNMNQRMPPASLTKLMTLYIVAGELKRGRIKISDNVRISENAWHTGGSRMFAQVGSQIGVQDLIDGIAIASGNDATVAMAEFIAGSQDSFAQFMNQTAQQLGMNNSHFTDANGLPDDNHYSSPYDLAKLTQAFVKNYPEYYTWFGQKWVMWNKIKQPNRNRLLWRDASVDGVKTGHTSAAGFCLISSAKRNNMRLITVVMGEPSEPLRVNDSQALLNWGFRFYETHQLFKANQTLTNARVWFGDKKYARMGVSQDIFVTIPTGQYNRLNASLNLNEKLQAPIAQGQANGTIDISLNGKPLQSIPLVALENDPSGGLFKRFSDHIAQFFSRWFG